MPSLLAFTSLLLLASSAEAATPEPLHVLVLDIKSDVLDERSLATLSEALAVYVSKKPHVTVTSGAEIKNVMELEAVRQNVGCDTDSCLSEIADAMGARFVVLGHVGEVGSRLVLTLSLFDGHAGASVGRALVQADDVAGLFSGLPRAVDEVMDPYLAKAGVDLGPPPAALWLGYSGGAALALGIAGVAAGAVPVAMFTLRSRTLDGAIEAYDEAPSHDGAALVVTARGEVDAWTRHWQTWGSAALASGGVLVVTGVVLLGTGVLTSALAQPGESE